MTQVYQFVDDNGVTRLFAEIVPDPAGTPFNGGTITMPLLVSGDGNPLLEAANAGETTVFQVVTQAGGESASFITDRASGEFARLQGAGAAYYFFPDGQANFDGTGGNSMWLLVRDADGVHHINVKTDAGVEIYASTSVTQLTIKDHSGNPIFKVNDDGSLHGKTGQALTFDL